MLVITLPGNKIGASTLSGAETADIITSITQTCGELVTNLGSVTNSLTINTTSSTYFIATASDQAITVNLTNYETLPADRSITFILKLVTTAHNSHFVFPTSPSVIPFGGSNPPIFEIPGTYHILFTYDSGDGNFYYGKAGSY